MSIVRSVWRLVIRGAACLLAVCAVSAAAQSSDSLQRGFENPPQSARPFVWWHWMNGNITNEGVQLDLDWMHRVGIAGFHAFDAALFTPQLVDKRLPYMTPGWKDAFRLATSLADKYGMEEGIAGSPGWSETGGPWVPASQAMKKYVWSETIVKGGVPFRGVVEHPPANTGSFQNLPVNDLGAFMRSSFHPPQYYGDSAVIAYKLAVTDVDVSTLHPVITSSAGKLDTSVFDDGDLVKHTDLPVAAKVGDKAWVQYEFRQPVTIRAVTLVAGTSSPFDVFSGPGGDSGETIETSDDGRVFRFVANVPKGGTTEHTIAFAPVSARFFRVAFRRMPFHPDPTAASLGFPSAEPTTIPIAELELHPGARVNEFEAKAAFAPVAGLESIPTPAYEAADAIAPGDVIDLTAKMRADGTLDWTPPPGRWVIVRIGYSLLGVTNHPATDEATGLEVDKLSATDVGHYINHYLDTYRDTVGASNTGTHGIQEVVTDSWEAGAQNWTDDMLAEFRKRRGYDPVPWLPVLTGRIVRSSAASDGFLWDFRQTIAEMTADNHYGELKHALAARDMRYYTESHESGRALIADGMQVKKYADIPMSAMWVQVPGVNKKQFGYDADDRESSSVAHIYGKKFVAAESMTTCNVSAAWQWTPGNLKPTVDQEFLNGINRVVIHESPHQALIGKAPGITLGPCGQAFDRNETWAEQARPWLDYIARSAFLLQQGHNVADILYFYGEDSNLTAIFADHAPDLPAGYNFDYVNADALEHNLSVKDGRIIASSGAQYRVLVLDPRTRMMSLPALRTIHDLVENGAIVIGAKPVASPSEADDPAAFARLAHVVFGNGEGARAVGRGKVFQGQSVAAVLSQLADTPDFDGGGSPVQFVHRRLDGAEVYFLDNRSDRVVDLNPSFRTSGRAPELWHAETGTSIPLTFHIAAGRTVVPLQLAPWEAVFVVFRGKTTASSRDVPQPGRRVLAAVSGSWVVRFQPGRGAQATTNMPRLMLWNQSADPGIRYFSGEGTYVKTIEVPPNWLGNGKRVLLDLGVVHNLAVITVNGMKVSTVWHAPFEADISSALKPGNNTLEITVVDSWVNRLIGDQQPGAKKIAFADIQPYKANSPLLPSGLEGPVQLLQEIPSGH